MVTVIKNKELIYDVFDYDVILIGTSINNALGNGFQYQIKKAFPEVDNANKNTPYGDIRKLGTVQVINTSPIFCLLYINKGRYRPDINPVFLDYNALENCIKLINNNFKGKKIASTIIGKSIYEGDGDYETIMKIIEDNSKDIDLYLYDFEQQDRNYIRTQKWNNIVNSVGKVSDEEYRNLKKQYYWEETFGLLKPCPMDLTEYQIKQIIKDYKNKNKYA